MEGVPEVFIINAIIFFRHKLPQGVSEVVEFVEYEKQNEMLESVTHSGWSCCVFRFRAAACGFESTFPDPSVYGLNPLLYGW